MVNNYDQPSLQKTTWQTHFLAWLMVILWASAYVGIRAGLTSYSPESVALLRYLVASFMMIGIALRQPNFRWLKWRELWRISICGIVGFSIYNVALNYGEISVSAGIASFIISQIPVLITILAVFFLREKITRMGWFGTLISIAGLTVISIGEAENMHIDMGVIFILIAAFAGSFYSILQKSILKRVHPIEFTAYAIWIGTAALCIFLPQLLHQLPRASIHATLWVIYLGIFPAAIAYLLWSYVLAKMPATKAVSYLYLVPLITVLMGWLILNEIPTVISICGGLIALAGAIIVNRNARG